MKTEGGGEDLYGGCGKDEVRGADGYLYVEVVTVMTTSTVPQE
jgi:hypothetical protein